MHWSRHRGEGSKFDLNAGAEKNGIDLTSLSICPNITALTRRSQAIVKLRLQIGGQKMYMAFEGRFLLVLFSSCLLCACAEIKETGRIIGHTTRDVTREIGHGTRDVVKAIGHGTKRAVNDIKDE